MPKIPKKTTKKAKVVLKGTEPEVLEPITIQSLTSELATMEREMYRIAQRLAKISWQLATHGVQNPAAIVKPDLEIPF